MHSWGRGLAIAALVLSACAAGTPSRPSTTAPVATSSLTSVSPPVATERATPSPAPPDLAELVEGRAMLEHLEALQRIADDHGGHRATNSDGFEASVEYVAGQLRSSGYHVELQEFGIGGGSSANLLVELAGSGGVVILGAHLDSVAAGPGINDNGSGVAALLVIADELRRLPPPVRTVRFAFWGAEEGGSFGSSAYVDALTLEERDRITAYLNFDMLASPNAVRLVYEEEGAAAGSQALTELFGASLMEAELAWEPIDLDGDSDHGPFRDAGIPTGGLFSGGIERVTDVQAAVFGVQSGEPADPCSHRACDTIDNVDLATLEEMADAIARALVRLAIDPA